MLATGARLRSRWLLVLALAGCLVAPSPVEGETRFSGHVGFSTDYVFRGRSHTRGEPATQAGVGFARDSGVFGGVWASRIDFAERWRSEVEIDYVLGWGRELSADWWAELVLRRYTYPRSPDPLDYDYTEFGGSARFRELVTLTITYAPGWSGYTLAGAVRNDRLLTMDAALEFALGSGFSAVGGLGRWDLAGPAGGSHLYWSGGIAYQFARVTVQLGYYDTDSAARRLIGGSAVDGKLVGTVLWEF